MDVPRGFTPFDPQGPFLEHIGPIQVRDGEDGPVFGLRAEERHTNHRGTIQGGLLSTFADFALGRAIEAGAEGGRGGPGSRRPGPGCFSRSGSGRPGWRPITSGAWRRPSR